MRERRPADFPNPLSSRTLPGAPRPDRRVRFRAASPDLLYGFGASALLTVAVFVFHLPQWQTALGGGMLALWFISMALARMRRNLSPPSDKPEQSAADSTGLDE